MFQRPRRTAAIIATAAAIGGMAGLGTTTATAGYITKCGALALGQNKWYSGASCSGYAVTGLQGQVTGTMYDNIESMSNFRDTATFHAVNSDGSGTSVVVWQRVNTSTWRSYNFTSPLVNHVRYVLVDFGVC